MALQYAVLAAAPPPAIVVLAGRLAGDIAAAGPNRTAVMLAGEAHHYWQLVRLEPAVWPVVFKSPYLTTKACLLNSCMQRLYGSGP